MKKTSLLLTIVFCFLKIQAQELREVISASPEAAALAKFINTPVNHTAGLPSIQIPFYTINTRSGLSIPIYISYHASGIKVNEHATQVGLGWKLSTGGMISSQTYGETDGVDKRRYPNFGTSLANSLSRFELIDEIGRLYCNSPEDLSFSYNYALDVSGLGILDGNPKLGDAQPDINYYETPTSSGKFVYDSDLNAHPIPYAPISIKNHNRSILGLVTIQDQNGNTFSYHNASRYSTFPEPLGLSNSFVEQNKLTTITTSLNEKIHYTYSTENYTYKNSEAFIDYTIISGIGCGDKEYFDTPSETRLVNQRLDKIEFDNGYVEFYYSDNDIYKIENSIDRKDLPGASALRRVVVFNNEDEIIKDFELFYSYFEADGGFSSDPDKYRLKLDRVVERGELPYDFTYNNENTIPHRLSTRQDYWGYYGGDGNGALQALRFQDIELPGSDRSVNESLVKTAALEKITYPTGGSTSFYFNEVTYRHPQPEAQVQINRTPVFSTLGTHSFTPPADSNNNQKVYFQNECGDTNGGISENFCFFTLYDENNQVLLQKSTPGVYDVSTQNSSGNPGSIFTFVLEGGDPNQSCSCSLYMEGEGEQEVLIDKKVQLPGLRLDRMVAEPLTGNAITTTFDYTIPGTNRISRNVSIPIFHYLEKTTTGVELNNGGGGKVLSIFS